MLPSPSALKSPCRHGQELQHRILNQSLFKTRNSLTRLFPLKSSPWDPVLSWAWVYPSLSGNRIPSMSESSWITTIHDLHRSGSSPWLSGTDRAFRVWFFEIRVTLVVSKRMLCFSRDQLWVSVDDRLLLVKLCHRELQVSLVLGDWISV